MLLYQKYPVNLLPHAAFNIEIETVELANQS